MFEFTNKGLFLDGILEIVNFRMFQFKQPQAVCGDLKFADRKSKSFKSFLFEFSQSKLGYYKDKKGSIKLGEWKIEDIIWYQGNFTNGPLFRN